MLNNGLGRYEAALAAAQKAAAGGELSATSWVLPELIEAVARLERWEVGAEALRELSERAQDSGTAWALGTKACARGQLTRGPDADNLCRIAIERLVACHMKAHLARARLAYGEWLRETTAGRTLAPRCARPTTSSLRWAPPRSGERARNELLATGETVRKRASDTTVQLTPQESLIASLAGTETPTKKSARSFAQMC